MDPNAQGVAAGQQGQDVVGARAQEVGAGAYPKSWMKLEGKAD